MTNDVVSQEKISCVGHRATVRKIVVTSDERFILSNSQDRTCKVWNLETGQLEKSFELSDSYHKMRGLAVSPDSKYGVIGYDDGWSEQFYVVNLNTWHLRSISDDRNLNAAAIAITPDSRYAIIGYDTNNYTIRIYELETLKAVGGLAGHGRGDKNWVSTIVTTPDGRYAISAASGLGEIKVWDLQKSDIKSPAIHTMYDTNGAITLTPDGRYLLSGSKDGTLKVRDWRTGEIRQVFKGYTGQIMSGVLTSDSCYLITCLAEKNIEVLAWPSGKLKYLLNTERSVNSLAITPDNRRLVFAVSKIINIWDLERKKPLGVITS